MSRIKKFTIVIQVARQLLNYPTTMVNEKISNITARFLHVYNYYNWNLWSIILDNILFHFSYLYFLEVSLYFRNIRSGREHEIFFEIEAISRVSNLSGFPKELGFGKGLGISLNNSLKPTPSTVSKDRRSRTTIRATPSVISFGLTIFRLSFCTYDKFYIDSVSLLSTYTYVWMHMPQMA